MLHKDEWLSQYFSGGAYSYRKSDEQECPLIQEGFVYAKIPSENYAEINQLIKQDFNLVEVLVNFEQNTPIQIQAQSDVEIGFVRSEEQYDVIEIARNAFLSSRLYQDVRIPHAIASQIKGDWVANFFLGKRGDNMIVARVNERVVGFLMLVNKVIIDLIAVSPKFYRKSIGSSMIGFANQSLGELLSAGTQLNNQASIAMYGKCGFNLKHSHFVLHKFFGNI